jgi:hypothetical protein
MIVKITSLGGPGMDGRISRIIGLAEEIGPVALRQGQENTCKQPRRGFTNSRAVAKYTLGKSSDAEPEMGWATKQDKEEQGKLTEKGGNLLCKGFIRTAQGLFQRPRPPIAAELIFCAAG